MSGCARMPTLSAQDCMARAMYFESNRSSPEGMMAVGTVVMNRLKSGKYPNSVCGVVGQKKQFAPGVLSKPMGKGRDLAYKTARVVLKGQRHPKVGKAMFFHTAGYSYPYNNMHYVAILGGNAFYEKRRDASSTQDMVRRKQARLDYVPTQRREASAVDPARYGTLEPMAEPVRRREAWQQEPQPAADLRSFSHEWTSVATGQALPTPEDAPMAPGALPPIEPGAGGGVTLYQVQE
ncbi:MULTISPECIES: cell wall hydrolase [unclassified Aureimonas]|uniref:cell wall hydrolase n=2 Tax=unclassified Aureimonas TaxID=2615206 RepID=UPI001FCDBA12|nr:MULTISPECIES: cell wall hydrolase [unclassified Aureimonas]